jgi:hypothetical protein
MAWQHSGTRRKGLGEMRLTGLESSIVAVIIGAIIGFVPNYLMDVRRERSLRRSRWDSALFDLCSDFASTARALQELCLRRASDGPGSAPSDDISEEHQKLRTLSERIRLLGDLDLQLSVRWIVRHAHAMREVSEGRLDPRREEFPEQGPYQRFGEALQNFYIAARTQLNVINPSAIAPRELEAGRTPSSQA